MLEEVMESVLNMKINTMKTEILVYSREKNKITTRIKLKWDTVIEQLDDLFRWEMRKGNSKKNLPGQGIAFNKNKK